MLKGGVGLWYLPFYDFSVWFLVVVAFCYTIAHTMTRCETNPRSATARLYTTRDVKPTSFFILDILDVIITLNAKGSCCHQPATNVYNLPPLRMYPLLLYGTRRFFFNF
ncbi:hypothetical protein HOY80DRAFT_939419 [Tuber brumale]|nr:hypothetical protein HOY80DRAFT_939419 [Tuber brumale]